MTAWTKQMFGRMRELYDRGDSHSSIAAVLNYEFNTSLSRNSIIGKAHRKGLEKRRNSGAFQNRAVKKKPAPKPVKWTAPVMKAEPFTLRQAAEIVPLHIELKDLTPDQCRWPYGDRLPFSFCGHPKSSKWYCAAHQELSTR